MKKENIAQIDYICLGDNYQFKLPLNIDFIIPKNEFSKVIKPNYWGDEFRRIIQDLFSN